MRIGTTSFGFRYQLLDRALAPPLSALVEGAHALGLEVLQICENARPLGVSEAEWLRVVAHGADLGVEVQIGAKTLDPAVIERYLDRALATPSRMLRAVLEEENSHQPPGRAELDALLAAVYPMLERRRARLAIENHFDIPSEMLAAAVAPYPADTIGFCVDTANSLRNFESPAAVMDLLGPRAFCYHLKDFSVAGHLLGFAVGGAPLGQGRLDVDWFLRAIPPGSLVCLENWVPATGDLEHDIREDERWLRLSLDALKSALGRLL
jgi:sugar phosphate isomerase/epimerase